MDKDLLKMLYGFLETGFRFTKSFNGGELECDITRLVFKRNGKARSVPVQRTMCIKNFEEAINKVSGL